MAETCAFIKSDGTRCRAHPLTGDQFCLSHSPSPKAKEIKAAAVKKGGRVRTKPEAILEWQRRPIDTTEDLRLALSQILNAGMSGAISTSQLSSLASVANVLFKLLEPPKDEVSDPGRLRLQVMRFFEERHPELLTEFSTYLGEIDE